MDERSRTVARVMAVLEQLSVAAAPLTNQQLAKTLEVPLSSMHRLLARLTELGYLQSGPDDSAYTMDPRLAALAGRLADIGGHSSALKSLMGAVRTYSGGTVSIWVASNLRVRLTAMMKGRVQGASTHAPGEIREPFSTPGLAIATTYSEERLRQVWQSARRRNIELGRRFRTLPEVLTAVKQVEQRGYAVGFNLRGDGWGIMAWPLPASLAPVSHAAMTVGVQVAELRKREQDIALFVERSLRRASGVSKTSIAES